MLLRRLAAACLAWQACAHAQEVIRNDEVLSSTRPEAWAMGYAAASTFMTAFGETPALAPWQWQAAGELGHIPRLSDAQQRVGFFGTKQEDLNRSPVFGRARVFLGLPAGFVAEAGYTPPVTIGGSSSRHILALAIGRRVWEHDRFTLSLRGFAQRGSAEGDITCPGGLAGAGVAENPFGCEEASNDRVDLDYYGMDATASWRFDGWRAHLGVGVVRTDLSVQVDALTLGQRDRSLLESRATRRFLAAGASYDIDRCWSVAAEVLHVPLKVQRSLDAGTEDDPFTGLRLQATFRFQ
jgi:hypothetical protein